MKRAAVLLPVAASLLAAQSRTWMVRFDGEGNCAGSISPPPARLIPWQFDSRDTINAAGWQCTVRRETYWDTPYERSMKGTSRRDKVTAKGVVAEYDAPVQPTVSSAAPFRLTAMPRVEWLTATPESDEDYPAVNSAGWIAWQAYDGTGDRVWVRRPGAAAEAITPSGGDVFRVVLAADARGRTWVIWSAQVNGNFDLYGRAHDGKAWAEVERITTAAGSDIYHAAVTDSGGRLHVAWMSAREGNFDIYTKMFDGEKWSGETRVSESAANDWEPAIAAAPDGSVTIAWDTYAAGNYDVVMRTLRGGKWGALQKVAASPAFEARVSMQYDRGGALWLAWDEGDSNWGKDYGQGIEENGRGLLVRRQIRVARWAGGRLEEPAAPFPSSLPEEFRQVMHQPRLALDAQQRPWIFFRYRVNLPMPARGGDSANRGSWRQAATAYTSGGWLPAIEFPSGFGRIDAGAAAALSGGDLLAAWSTDHRAWPYGKPSPHDIVSVRVTAPPADAAPGPLRPFTATAEALPPSHAREAADLERIRAHRVTIGGRQYRIVRGDIHRHTDVSWDGNRDGSLHDAYRYAMDAAGFEYMGVCDHQAGNTAYGWWMIQKAVDLFSIAGRFAPLYSYERSLPYPNGHRNVLFAERGRPILPIGDAEQKGTEGAAKLYEYLRRFGGLTTSHTSATGAGTDWRDSSADLEPVVEIYQGYRRNYEGPDTPRAPRQGEEPSRFAAGYVWNAWAKGIRMGVQSSSDHVSTHISYAAFYVDRIERVAILDAIRARRTYAATDNIVMELRSGPHFMGESFRGGGGPVTLAAYVAGTGPIDRVDVIRNNAVVYTRPGSGAARERFTYVDRDAGGSGARYYYIRALQKDGQIAWSSPLWVDPR